MPPADAYSGGLAYREGLARPTQDVAMTILEYRAVPEPTSLGLLAVGVGFVALGRRGRS